MKRIRYSLIAVFFLVTILVGTHVQGAQDVLFQTSTFDALDKGVAEGEVTIKNLKQHGDFGIGTFNAVDGEMVVLDGNCYQIKMDGVAYPVDDSMKTPFSFVTSF